MDHCSQKVVNIGHYLPKGKFGHKDAETVEAKEVASLCDLLKVGWTENLPGMKTSLRALRINSWRKLSLDEQESRHLCPNN